MVKLIKQGAVFGIKRYSGAAAGDLAKDDAKVAAIGDRPLGFIVDDIRTDNPPPMLDVHGNGAIIDLTGFLTAAAPGTVVYSDGDGTISSVRPAGVAGTMIWVVGTIYPDEDGGNSSFLSVDIQNIEKGAA